MRIKYLVSVLCAVVSLPYSAFALYNGCADLPEMPIENLFFKKDSLFSLKVDYEGDYLLSRNLAGTSSFSDPRIKSMFNGSAISFGFIDRVEMYTLLGASKTHISGYVKDGEYLKLTTKQSFGGEIGARAIAAFWGETKLGVDAKYFYGWPRPQSLEVDGKDVGDLYSQSMENQWQVGLSLSQKFAFFMPYVGVKYSRFVMNFVGLTDVGNAISLENKSPFGFFLGLGIAGKKGCFFNFEWRFIDEYAFTGSFGVRF